MSMSDCEKCWDTPCTCGYEYRNYSLPYRMKLASVILGVDVSVIQGAFSNTPLPEVHPMKQDEPIKHLMRGKI